MMMDIKSIINRVLHLSGYQVMKIENSSGFRDFVSSRNLEAARGVLHIGAHFGEERFAYSKLDKPVIWIEAVPDYFEKLVSNISGFEIQRAHQMLLSDQEKEVDFHIASNEGSSSSLFNLADNNGFEHSGLHMESSIRLTTIRLDNVFTQDDLMPFDHWVVDVQGAEMEVLKGAGELLNSCNSMMIEVSRREIYVGGSDYFELTNFLNDKGFIQIWEAHSQQHTDVLFVRRASNHD